MIEIGNVETYGWQAAIRGMRNPKNSWDKSDTYWDIDEYDYVVGEQDLKLMQTLVKAGNDHGKFMRMIGVSVDIVAPLYWWKEFDTYKVGTVANSCSTMHKIHAKEFTPDDFSHEHLNEKSLYVLNDTIKYLNAVRELFLNTKNKDYWWQMIQLLPSSYNQRRTVMFNYAVLKNIYASRKTHKLDEWRDFCKWIEQLPYSNLITGED